MHPISLARGLPPGFEWTSLHPLREPGLARARGVARVQAKTCWLQVSWVRYYCSNPKKDRHINFTKTVIHYFSIFLGVAICLLFCQQSFFDGSDPKGFPKLHCFIHVDTKHLKYCCSILVLHFGSPLLNPSPDFVLSAHGIDKAMWRALPSTANHDGRWKL